MEKVKRQIKFIRELLDDLEEKTGDRSFWRGDAWKKRVEEIEALETAVELLKRLVKTATLE